MKTYQKLETEIARETLRMQEEFVRTLNNPQSAGLQDHGSTRYGTPNGISRPTDALLLAILSDLLSMPKRPPKTKRHYWRRNNVAEAVRDCDFASWDAFAKITESPDVGGIITSGLLPECCFSDFSQSFGYRQEAQTEFIDDPRLTENVVSRTRIHKASGTAAADVARKRSTQLETVRQKLAMFLSAITNLGDFGSEDTLKETYAAVRSVFPLQEAGEFLASSAEERISRIRELEQVVGGIRVYNKLRGSGGADIEDTRPRLRSSVEAGAEKIEAHLREIYELCDAYTTYLRSRHEYLPPPCVPADDGGCGTNDVGDDDGAANGVNAATGNNDGSAFDGYIRRCLINARQGGIFLRSIHAKLRDLRDAADEGTAKLEETSLKLKALTHELGSVPSTLALPLFVGIWELWQEFGSAFTLAAALLSVVDRVWKRTELQRIGHSGRAAILLNASRQVAPSFPSECHYSTSAHGNLGDQGDLSGTSGSGRTPVLPTTSVGDTVHPGIEPEENRQDFPISSDPLDGDEIVVGDSSPTSSSPVKRRRPLAGRSKSRRGQQRSSGKRGNNQPYPILNPAKFSAEKWNEITDDLELLGHCGCCLSSPMGILIPADPSYGAVRFRGRYYGFCSVTCASVFAYDPRRILSKVAHVCQRSPELGRLMTITRGRIREAPSAKLVLAEGTNRGDDCVGDDERIIHSIPEERDGMNRVKTSRDPPRSNGDPYDGTRNSSVGTQTDPGFVRDEPGRHEHDEYGDDRRQRPCHRVLATRQQRCVLSLIRRMGFSDGFPQHLQAAAEFLAGSICTCAGVRSVLGPPVRRTIKNPVDASCQTDNVDLSDPTSTRSDWKKDKSVGVDMRDFRVQENASYTEPQHKFYTKHQNQFSSA